MASQPPPAPNVPGDTPVDDPVPSPVDPSVPMPTDPIVGGSAGGEAPTEGP